MKTELREYQKKMSEEEVIALMKSSKNESQWDQNCDEVKRKNNGYPAFWFSAIVQSGVMADTQASWSGV